jgi:hypothetical protein
MFYLIARLWVRLVNDLGAWVIAFVVLACTTWTWMREEEIISAV